MYLFIFLTHYKDVCRYTIIIGINRCVLNKMLGICKNLKLILLVVAFAISFLLPSYSKAAQISGLRIGQGADGVRLVFDAGAKFNYNVFTLTAPKRLVIDTQNIDISPEILNNLPENPYVNNVRAGITVDSGVRIVFDLSRPVVIKKTFMLAPQSNFKWRLAIDLQVSMLIS